MFSEKFPLLTHPYPQLHAVMEVQNLAKFVPPLHCQPTAHDLLLVALESKLGHI